MRIATWNIRHGGTHILKPQIARAIWNMKADVVVITEFRIPTERGDLLSSLRSVGFTHMLHSDPPRNQNGVLAISKTPITRLDIEGPDFLPHRALHFSVGGHDMEFLGLYVPPVSSKNDHKRMFWQYLNAHADAWGRDRDLVVLGDLNTGIRGVDESAYALHFTDQFAAFLQNGFVDLYREIHPTKRSYSWFWPHRDPHALRLDHCLATPSIAKRVTNAGYASRIGEDYLVLQRPREYPEIQALSDHAALVVDLQ